MFAHRKITLKGPAPLRVNVDRVQLHQLLINLIKNADEAMSDTTAPVCIEWSEEKGCLFVTILDQGVGLTNPKICLFLSIPPNPMAVASG